MRDHVVAQRRRDLAAAEGLSALGAEAFQRLGQLGEAEDAHPRAGSPVGRVELARALQPRVDRLEDVEDVGLLGVDRRPLAGEPNPGSTSSASGIVPKRCSASSRPAAVPGTPQDAGPT